MKKTRFPPIAYGMIVCCTVAFIVTKNHNHPYFYFGLLILSLAMVALTIDFVRSIKSKG